MCNILQNMDKKKVTGIILRNISAAFETVNYSLHCRAKPVAVEHSACLERHQTLRQDRKK